MINIFYTNKNNGPGKVVDYLIKGLDLKGIPYSVNPQNVNSEDNNVFLQNHRLMNNPQILSNSLIGPNICVLPIDDELVMSQNYKKMLVPSNWVKEKYMKWLPETKLEIWPVGIDTNSFIDTKNENKTIDCLIYYKRRDIHDLRVVEGFLSSKNQTYKTISYGGYSENIFLESIKTAKYGIVIDSCESQGIAIQEMMSSNLPLLVWDVSFWSDRGEEYKVPASSIPYWDDVCGERFYSFPDLDSVFNKFIDNLHFYNPRKYILENLSLSDQSTKLINLFL